MVHISLDLSVSEEVLSHLKLMLLVHPCFDRRILIAVNKHFDGVADLKIMDLIGLRILDVHLEGSWNVFWQFEREWEDVLSSLNVLTETIRFAATLHEHNLAIEFIQLFKCFLFLLVVGVLVVIQANVVTQIFRFFLVHLQDLMLI